MLAPRRAPGDRESRDRCGDVAVDLEHSARPPPLIVTPAAGPVIVSVPVVSLSSSCGPSQGDRLQACRRPCGSRVIALSRNVIGEADRLAKSVLTVDGGGIGGGVDHQARDSQSVAGAGDIAHSMP